MRLLSIALLLLVSVGASAAITGTDRGVAGDTTAGATWAWSPSSNFASATSWGVAALAVDNAETGGVAHTVFTLTDDLGNTWTRQIAPLCDAASTLQGVEGAIFTTPQDGGQLTTATVITATFANAGTDTKVATLIEVTPTAGSTIEYVTGGVGTCAASTTPTVTTSSITSGNMVIGAVFIEYGTNQTITEDADTTNGVWSTQQTTETGGTGNAGQSVASQWKVVTASATQTYDPTLGTAADLIEGWIELTETAAGGSGLLLRRRRN